MKNNIFGNIITNCLVSLHKGTNLEEVSQTLKDTHKYGKCTTGIPCYICGENAEYIIVPKEDTPVTAFLEDKGYICNNCLSMGYLDKNQYGIRKLE